MCRDRTDHGTERIWTGLKAKHDIARRLNVTSHVSILGHDICITAPKITGTPQWRRRFLTCIAGGRRWYR